MCFKQSPDVLTKLLYVDSFLEAQNGSTAQGFRDRLVTTLERKALGVGYETQVMVDSTQTYMNKQDGSLLLRLQEAIDQVNAGRAWNKETVDYFLKKHGDEAEQKAAERAERRRAEEDLKPKPGQLPGGKSGRTVVVQKGNDVPKDEDIVGGEAGKTFTTTSHVKVPTWYAKVREERGND